MLAEPPKNKAAPAGLLFALSLSQFEKGSFVFKGKIMAENEMKPAMGETSDIGYNAIYSSNDRPPLSHDGNRKKQVITLAAIKDKTYGGPDFIVAAHSSSGLPVTLTATGACSIVGNKVQILKAGLCTITAHQDGDDHFDAAVDVSRGFKINPARLIIAAESKVSVYGAALPVFTVTISGLVNGDTPETLGEIEFLTTAIAGSPVGTHIVTPGGITSTNYTIDYISGKLTILPATAIVKADDKNMEYGQPIPEFSASISGLVGTDTLPSLGKLSFLTTAVSESAVGIYTIIPEGLSSPNYSFEYINGKLTISPAIIKIIADDKNMEYGQSLPDFTATISGLMNEDTLDSPDKLTFLTTAAMGSSVGSYTIIPDGLSSSNYAFEYISGKLEILPAKLQITADDKTVIYGQPMPEFSAKVSGLANRDTLENLGTLSFYVAAKQGSPVGTYAILPAGLAALNYTVEYIEGKLEILPAELKMKAEDKTVAYGQPMPEFSVIISGLIDGDNSESLGDISFMTQAKQGSPSGDYTIMPQVRSSQNYRIEHIEGKITIKPALLKVKANNKRLIYGEQIREFTAEISGLVHGDSLEDLGKITFNTMAKQGSPVGFYSVMPGGLTSSNYIIEYVEGKVEIVPAIVKIKADDKTVVAGGSLPEFSAGISGLINGDTIESLGKLSFQTDAKADSPAGLYSIVPGGLTSPNYNFAYSRGTLTILPLSKTAETPPIQQKIVEALAADQITDVSAVKKPRLGELLVNEGTITSDELAKALSKQLDVPSIDINTFQIERDALKLVSESVAKQYSVMPLAIRNGYLVVAMADPTDIMAIEALTALTKTRIKPLISTPEDIKKTIDRNYKSLGELEKQFVEVATTISEQTTILDEQIAAAPAVRALDIIVEEAIKNRASDIHIEPQIDKVRIRYRIDGVLHEVSFLPYSAHGPLISRLKVLSEMNIADHRPQDGQFSFKAWDKEVDLRVATISTAYGEMATLRILDKSYAVRSLKGIGFSPKNMERFEKMLKSPFGMILVSGPTGSGKTTTLYAAIYSMDCKESKIITIEDPVEYHFEGINQIQVNPRGGLNFSDGVRALMRHDPDVMLIGEVRDQDTSSTAVQAAMTGHLVLASVHANDTVGVIFRLIDLGVEPFLLSTALVGILAQRMVRRVCPHCREEREAPIEYQAAYFDELGESRDKFYYGKGCDLCSNTGYLGRTAVMEILSVNDEIKRLILTGASNAQIRAQAIKDGMKSMRYDGMLKVKDGITTPNEILKNVLITE